MRTCETEPATKDESFKIVDVNFGVDKVDSVDVPHLESGAEEGSGHFTITIGALLAQDGQPRHITRIPRNAHFF